MDISLNEVISDIRSADSRINMLVAYLTTEGHKFSCEDKNILLDLVPDSRELIIKHICYLSSIYDFSFGTSVPLVLAVGNMLGMGYKEGKRFVFNGLYDKLFYSPYAGRRVVSRVRANYVTGLRGSVKLAGGRTSFAALKPSVEVKYKGALHYLLPVK